MIFSRTKKRNQVFNREYFIRLLALQLLLLPAVILTLTALLWWFTLPITALHFPISLGVTIGVSFLLINNKTFQPAKIGDFSKTGSRLFFKTTGIFILLILVTFFISTEVYDFSLDGQVYHQPGIIILESGWIPFHQHFIGAYHFLYRKAAGDSAAIVNHFSKASWILAASVYAFTGSLEAGKMFHLLLLVAAFFTSLHFLFFLKKVPKKSKFIIAALAALNPVCLYQLSCFGNDGLLASLLTILIAAALQYLVFADRKAIFFMALTIPILVNIKFTGLVYGIIIVTFTWLAMLIIKKSIQARFILYMAAAFITAVVLVGYQPYITNIIHKKNPFYPAIMMEKGKDTKNIEWGQAPKAFLEKTRVSKLLYSLFSRSDNNLKQMPQLKIPFTVSGSELVAFIGPDARYGGFGPLFGSVLLLVIAALPMLLKLKRMILIYTLIASTVVLISALINPEAWWARLSPQLWLLPLIFIITSYYFKKGVASPTYREPGIVSSKNLRNGAKVCFFCKHLEGISKNNNWIKYLRGFLIFVLIINCLIILVKNTGHKLKVTRLFTNQMRWMANNSRQMKIRWEIYPHKTFLSTQYRLNKFNVPHKMKETLKNKRTRPIIGSWGAAFYLEGRVYETLNRKRIKK